MLLGKRLDSSMQRLFHTIVSPVKMLLKINAKIGVDLHEEMQVGMVERNAEKRLHAAEALLGLRGEHQLAALEQRPLVPLHVVGGDAQRSQHRQGLGGEEGVMKVRMESDEGDEVMRC